MSRRSHYRTTARSDSDYTRAVKDGFEDIFTGWSISVSQMSAEDYGNSKYSYTKDPCDTWLYHVVVGYKNGARFQAVVPFDLVWVRRRINLCTLYSSAYRKAQKLAKGFTDAK